jgi:nitric oxide dioxygenase
MHSAPPEQRTSILSEQSEAVVKATAPVVVENAEAITARFYPKMFADHPELLRLFNQGNQATGEQSQALAASVVAYAVHLIDPDAPDFGHVMRRIANKHVSLGVRPEQYTVVAHYLIAAVADVLGDAVTPEVAAAWTEVYWLFAAQLVAEEARLYQQSDVDFAHPLRAYRVVRRIQEAKDIISLVLEPTDGGDLPAIAPGQYVSVFVNLRNGDRQPRQYTVSSTASGRRLQITVGRVRGVNGAPDGQVSSFLHDEVKVGDVIEVSVPAGDLLVESSDSPLLLATAGAGITTALPIVEHVARTQPNRKVIVAHADQAAQGPCPARDRRARRAADRRLHDLQLVRVRRSGRQGIAAGSDGPLRSAATGRRARVHVRAAAVHATCAVEPVEPGCACRTHLLRGVRARPVGRPAAGRSALGSAIVSAAQTATALKA